MGYLALPMQYKVGQLEAGPISSDGQHDHLIVRDSCIDARSIIGFLLGRPFVHFVVGGEIGVFCSYQAGALDAASDLCRLLFDS